MMPSRKRIAIPPFDRRPWLGRRLPREALAWEIQAKWHSLGHTQVRVTAGADGIHSNLVNAMPPQPQQSRSGDAAD
jgi:hypothetical protein